MASKPESPKIMHIVIPAVSTLLVALIGLGTAIYQTERPIQQTEAAETVLAFDLTTSPKPPTPVPSNTPAPTNTATPLPTATNTLQPSATNIPLSTATNTQPPTISTPAGPLTFTVKNLLVLPVTISVNNIVQGTVAANSTQTFQMQADLSTVAWDVVKKTTSDGTPLGNDMGGIWSKVNDGDELDVDNIIDQQYYFYPIITNPGSVDCYVTINKGWENEVVTNAFVPAYTNNVGMGYYKLYNNSNVYLLCGKNYYWWGTLPDEGNPVSFYGNVTPDSGVIYFTLNP